MSQTIHPNFSPMTKGKNANLRVTSKIFETGKFASSKSKFKKPAKFHFSFNFQQKISDNFVRKKLKVNSILTSLDFFLSNFQYFRLCFFFLGIFGGFAEQDTIKHFQSNSVGSAECLSRRWKPSDLNLVLLEFLQNLKDEKLQIVEWKFRKTCKSFPDLLQEIPKILFPAIISFSLFSHRRFSKFH